MYKLFPAYGNLKFQTWRTNAALEEVAFDSPASSVCASLMGLNPKTQQLRLVKDAVLGFQAGDKGCDWHVDDKSFWPCEDRKFGKPDAGVNAWITLSPISKKTGGGLAVARGSHVMKKWTRKARELIAERGPMTTCLLQSLDLESWKRMEELKETHDLQPGDAIFHNRYLFHKGDSFYEESNSRKKKDMKHRISLRYMPADATFEGFDSLSGSDPVVERKGLKTGDALSKGGEYFPQTWPHRLPEEQQKRVLAHPEVVTMKGIFQIVKIIMRGKKNQDPESQ